MQVSDPAAKRRRARVRSWAILVVWVLLLWVALTAARAHATDIDSTHESSTDPAISRSCPSTTLRDF
jgi:hypothetical protein